MTCLGTVDISGQLLDFQGFHLFSKAVGPGEKADLKIMGLAELINIAQNFLLRSME